ncbi:protein Gis4p [Monosporozyma servazzii]
MPVSVRVDDYYDNNENGLWSWYLNNIRTGNFEKLTSNTLKYTLLKRFLNTNLIDNKFNANKNKKILFISIPEKVHSDIAILETFLQDYFHLENLQYINITKLTQDHCYNHENHYLLIDEQNNFNDPTFLNYVDPKRYNKVVDNPPLKENSLKENSLKENSLKENSLKDNFVKENSIKDAQSIMSDDTESSIVLNFPRAPLHHIRHTQDQKKLLKRESVDSLLHNVLLNGNIINNNNNNNNNNGHSFTPPGSDLVSINSFYNDEMEGDDEDGEDHPIKKHSLMRMLTPNEQDVVSSTSNGLTESDIIPTTNNTNMDENEDTMNDSDSFVSSISCDSYSSYSSSTSSISYTSPYYSILPSISINDQCGHFRLVLQSALLYNENKEIFTAIRQSNNDVNKASVKDDWILYDSKFSMNNLVMLTLKELFDFSHDLPKILFYSMVVIDPIVNNNSTKKKTIDNNDIISVSNDLKSQLEIKEDTDNESLEEEIANLNPEMLYDDDDDNNTQDELKMYIPERMVSNVTTAGHRSIRTVNSIGEWAYRKKSNISGITYDNDSNDSDVDNFLADENKIKTQRENDLERRDKIERWKSLPNHNNNHSNDDTHNDDANNDGNGDNNSAITPHGSSHKNHSNYKNKRNNDGIIHSGGERWKLNMKRFKKSNDNKKEDDKICSIM